MTDKWNAPLLVILVLIIMLHSETMQNDCSAGDFNDQLVILVRKSKSCDILAVEGDSSAQVHRNPV